MLECYMHYACVPDLHAHVYMYCMHMHVICNRGVRHSVKSRTPWLKSILKSRNQKPAEIRNHFLSQNYSAKSLKLLQSKK